MSKPFRKPARHVVERIIREEAREMRVSYRAVLCGSLRQKCVDARRRAIARIITETGCSERGLAIIWGLDSSGVSRIARNVSRTPPPYDPGTIARLVSHYGAERAGQIVRGEDPNTQQDIAAWRRLCAKGARP